MFSDGVFAVAITLLALNLTVAGPGHGALTGQLAGHWQAFVAYLISFFTIGVTWVNHHSLLSNVEAVTRSLLFFNLVLLLFVVLVPAATKLLADYLLTGGFGAHVAAAVYGMVLEGIGVGFILILEWTLREGRTQPSVPPDQRWAVRLRYLLGPAANLLVIGAAFINPLLALGLFGAAAVYYVFEQTPLRVKGRGIARPDEPGDARRLADTTAPRRASCTAAGPT
jgi:TMEM175 potassium channel family protein